MKLKVILVMVILCLFEACAFKKGDGSGGENGGTIATTSELKADPNGDADGDGISNQNEIENGTDPFIADVPRIETSFVQNFLINVKYNQINNSNVESFSISTKQKNTDPSFKYRVGKLFGVENAQNLAAKVGRFSSHSYGEIKNEDFSWIKYPSLDPLLQNYAAINLRPKLEAKEENPKFENFTVNLNFENSVKLLGNRFKEIKDLNLNFYYHDIEKDTYVLLKSTIIERTFQRNIFEKFQVEIENVPLPFLKDTYLKQGEFLISEIDNYYIPELGKDYKTLMSAVKAKTIPVLLSTPSEETVYFVAASKGVSFLEILNRLFTKNFVIENNELKKIGQYETNLGSFEYLKDVKDKDKLGKWFVLTNKFKEQFVDHIYSPTDEIALNYILGNDLATRTESLQQSYQKEVSTVMNNETVVQLGTIGPNSKVEIGLKGLNTFGNEVLALPFNGSWSFGGGNSTKLNYSCDWIGNKKVQFNKSFELPITYNAQWDNISLAINEESFKLSNLIAEKKVTIQNIDFNYLVSIEDISKIKPIKQADENHLSLILNSTLTKAHQGLKLLSSGGNQNSPWCTGGPGNLSTIDLANSQFGGEVSKGSLDISVIEKSISDARIYPNNTGAASVLNLKLMDDIFYDQNYSFAINSKITNYFN